MSGPPPAGRAASRPERGSERATTEFRFEFVFTGGAPAAIHVHLPGDTSEVLDAVHQLGAQMALDTSALIAAVTAIETVGGGVIEVLNRISAQLADLIAQSGNTVDPAEIQSVIDRLNAERDAIAAAVENVPPATP